MKTCRKCGESKPESEFYHDKTMADGLRSACKECIKAQSQEYRYEHHEATLEQVRRYSQSEQGRTKHRLWNRDRMRRKRQSPEFRKAERERARTPHAQALRRERWLRYAHTSRGIEAQRRAATKRRSRMDNIICDFSADDWSALLEKHGHQCFYCRTKFTNDNPPTRDHVVPIAKGGSHTKDNIVPACKRCNSSKGVSVWPKS